SEPWIAHFEQPKSKGECHGGGEHQQQARFGKWPEQMAMLSRGELPMACCRRAQEQWCRDGREKRCAGQSQRRCADSEQQCNECRSQREVELDQHRIDSERGLSILFAMEPMPPKRQRKHR